MKPVSKLSENQEYVICHVAETRAHLAVPREHPTDQRYFLFQAHGEILGWRSKGVVRLYRQIHDAINYD